MYKIITSVGLAAMLASSGAMAQTATTPSAPNAPTTTPMQSPPSTPGSDTTTMSKAGMTLTDQEAKNWISKPVYSSDNKKIGEVSELQRDASGKVTELHADIGGFLGLGQTRVRVMPSQFKLDNDRVVLDVPSDQAKSLPQLTK